MAEVRVNTLVLLMAVAYVVLALLVVAFTVGAGDIAGLAFTASFMIVSLAIGIAISRRVLGERGELTLGEQRRRFKEGTLPPIDARLVRSIRNFGLVTLSAMGIAVPTLWIELGATWGIILAAVTACGSISTWRVYSKIKRQAQR
jgi:hypothetical protein